MCAKLNILQSKINLCYMIDKQCNRHCLERPLTCLSDTAIPNLIGKISLFFSTNTSYYQLIISICHCKTIQKMNFVKVALVSVWKSCNWKAFTHIDIHVVFLKCLSISFIVLVLQPTTLPLTLTITTVIINLFTHSGVLKNEKRNQLFATHSAPMRRQD